ncbi:MAG: RNA polymerase sigma-70 factor [Salinivirgaceae bacterium]|jgi:RNA polymerase sigma-70 factor (ECF subfamily)|nr:RNA polymerase sigma-70 factor [Salinivirgaceae bacterium]
MKHFNAEQVINKLFNENFHSLVFKSFRIVNDYELAEDIVQNVFIKIWQNFEKVKHIDNLAPYLAKTVHNSSLNYLRDHKFENNKMPIENANLETDDADSLDFKKDDVLTSLHQAVDNLPPNWRKAFILSKYEKFKYYEIAEQMKISDKTVEKYISKALKQLRNELKHLIRIITLFF